MPTQRTSTIAASRIRITEHERPAEATSRGLIGTSGSAPLASVRGSSIALVVRARGGDARPGLLAQPPNMQDAYDRSEVGGHGEDPERPQRLPDEQTDGKEDDPLGAGDQTDRSAITGGLGPGPGVA